MSAASLARFRETAGAARATASLLLGHVGFAHSPARLQRDAARYWASDDEHWRDDSHWRGGSKFAGTGLWEAMGQEHLRLYQRLRAASAVDPAPPGQIVDWGCGGGANAVAFAPLGEGLTGVDLSAESVAECEKQVIEAAQVPFTGVVASVARPEDAIRDIPRPCGLFVCLYVLELVPDQAYGLRLMRIAHDLLVPGGQAFVQVKYATNSWRTMTRRRDYRRAVAGCTYRIEEFWAAMTAVGFSPEAVTLVPRNDLDERYAYFLLSKPR